MNNIFDLIVIGGGHAGVEAALAGRRLALSVGLVTLDEKKSGRMSCNPAIGGIGKTHFCLLYTSPSPRDATLSRMPSSA